MQQLHANSIRQQGNVLGKMGGDSGWGDDAAGPARKKKGERTDSKARIDNGGFSPGPITNKPIEWGSKRVEEFNERLAHVKIKGKK